MKCSIEEINLMCIYDCSDRFKLIDELEEVIPYVEEPEMLELMDNTIDKLYRMTDQEFAELPLYPADEEEPGGEENALSV